LSEFAEQAIFFNWVRYRALTDERFDLIWHTPNGGSRHPAEARRLKEVGVQAGVPDVFCAIPTTAHPGMFLEFKYGKGRLGENQVHYLRLLRQQGYKCEVVYSHTEAIKAVCEYLQITDDLYQI